MFWQKPASHDAVMYLIHHIFLPQKLPQEDDFSSEHQAFLLDITIETLSSLGPGYFPNAVRGAIANLRNLHDFVGSSVHEKRLRKALSSLKENGQC